MDHKDELSHFARIRDENNDCLSLGLKYAIWILNSLIALAIAYPVLMLLHIALASIAGGF